MPQRSRAFVATFGAAVIVVSGLIDRGASSERVVTGEVTEISGRSVVVNGAMTFVLNDATEYGDRARRTGLDPAALVPGTRVQVWYVHNAGERWRSAHRVWILPVPPPE